MRKRDIFLPSLTAVIIVGMTNFMSCAHQNRAGEDNYEDPEMISENAEPAEEVKDAKVAEGESEKVGDAAAEESLKSLTGDEKTADPTLEALGSEIGGEAAPEVAQGEGEMTKLDPNAPPPDIDPSLLDNPPTPEEPKNFANNDVQAEPANPLPTEPQTATPDAPEQPRTASYGGASVPKIPSKAIARKGVSLNRFYFVRSGDTPNAVSRLLYGDTSHSSKLTTWNGNGWTAGKILYYASPTDPQDGKMRSFYQERNVPSQDYEVRGGDWLSRIAVTNLGHSGSWKEIAVVNGMQQPDDLEPGQKLAIYPRDLTPFAQGNQVANNDTQQDTAAREEVPQETIPQNNSIANNQLSQEPPTTNSLTPEPQAPVADPIPAAIPQPKKLMGQKMDINKLIEQNLFTIVIGAGLVILLLALSAIKRRKARAGDEFGGDEGFAAPPKLRRK